MDSIPPELGEACQVQFRHQGGGLYHAVGRWQAAAVARPPKGERQGFQGGAVFQLVPTRAPALVNVQLEVLQMHHRRQGADRSAADAQCLHRHMDRSDMQFSPSQTQALLRLR